MEVGWVARRGGLRAARYAGHMPLCLHTAVWRATISYARQWSCEPDAAQAIPVGSYSGPRRQWFSAAILVILRPQRSAAGAVLAKPRVERPSQQCQKGASPRHQSAEEPSFSGTWPFLLAINARPSPSNGPGRSVTEKERKHLRTWANGDKGRSALLVG